MRQEVDSAGRTMPRTVNQVIATMEALSRAPLFGSPDARLDATPGWYVLEPEAGRYGCLNTAMSFMTRDQVEGDDLESGVHEGKSIAAVYYTFSYYRDN